MRMLAGAAALLAASGCAGPTGPVVGDWRGAQPSIDIAYSIDTELILDGTPDATSGTYHLVSRVRDPNFGSENQDDVRWTDHWEKRTLRDATGRPYPTIHLNRAPGVQRPDYILTSNGLLVPLIEAAHPDVSPAALRFALVPLPRTAFGYGRP